MTKCYGLSLVVVFLSLGHSDALGCPTLLAGVCGTLVALGRLIAISVVVTLPPLYRALTMAKIRKIAGIINTK
jgi:hypothetical protein